MISEQLKKLREQWGLNQTQLAKSLNLSKQSLSNWENDNILPSVEAVVSIAKFFGVSTDYLLGIEPKRQLDATGLTDQQASHVQILIKDLTIINMVEIGRSTNSDRISTASSGSFTALRG